MKKTLLLFLLLPFFGFAQLSGDYIISNANTNADFKTLVSAVAKLNAVGVTTTGPVVRFLLDENQTVSSQLTITQFANTSATRTVTIKPNDGKDITISGNIASGSVLALNNGDNIIIDGNNTIADNKLRINNTFNTTNSNTSRLGIWLSNGSDNNIIQNLTIELNIAGLTTEATSAGIMAGSTTIGGNGNNINNTIQNITFTKVKQAIIIKGQDQSNTGWKILNNKIESTDDNTKAYLGIYVLNTANYTVTGNSLIGIKLPAGIGGSPTHSGIYLENANNGVVSKNTLSNIENLRGTYFGYGIYVSGNNASIRQNSITNVNTNSTNTGAFGIRAEGNNTTIFGNKIATIICSQAKLTAGIYTSGDNQLLYNNYVNNVASTGGGEAWTQDGFGIFVNSGSTIKLYHNSVNLTTNQASGSSAALYLYSGSGFDIRNNIFVNAQTSSNMRFAIFSQEGNASKFTNINNNDYYSTQYVGCFGSYYTTSNLKSTLVAWQGATTQDAASKNSNPTFTNSTLDLDTNNATNKTLLGTTALLSTVTDDIYSSARVKPYMGAYEIFTCIPQGDQIAYGTNSWIGYVYKFTVAPTAGIDPTDPNPSSPTILPVPNMTYIGKVEESKLFNRDVIQGGVTGVNPMLCETPIDYFFVRYKMKTTVAVTGTYNITLGGDDLYRLYLNGTKIIDQWSGQNYSQKAVNMTLNAGTEYTFDIEYYERTTDSRIQFSMGLIAGSNAAPYPFGDNLWKVYGFTTARDHNTDFPVLQGSYAGFYSVTPVNINTTNSFAILESPSYNPAISGWQGAPVPQDFFTLVYKREGFPCGAYKIEVANCDDNVQIYLNENATPIYTSQGNINTPVNINTGTIYNLNKTSKIEIRLKEYKGNAKMAINFVSVPTTYDGTGPAPTNTTAITISSNTTLQSDIEVCSCTINPNVIFTIPSDKTLTVYEDINVGTGGKLLVQSGGALLQKSTSKTLFTGDNTSFELQRITPPVRRYDLTFWSSPLTTASGFKLYNLSPETLGDKYYIYNSLTESWITDYNGGTVMVPGKGYVVRAPQTFDVNTTKTFQASFIGIPNNGDIALGTLGAKWNFGGNPYPSALDAKMFITVNGNVGSLYLWTHSTAPSDVYQGDGIYNYNSADYAVFNLTGTAATTAPTNIPLGYIAAGQGFFFKPSNSNGVTFTNDMRVAGNNKQFFKTENDTDTDRSRVWLNLTNAQGAFKQALIGYLEGATNSWDINYDAETISGNSYIDFYSVNDSRKLTVQGRAIPFDDTEVVPLGYKTTVAGDFTIAIDHADGLFADHAVYLEDKKTGNVQNLAAGNYTFTTAIGTFTDRFVLHYTSKNLGTGDFENPENTVLVSVKDKAIKIAASKETIKDVAIFDITGKQLYTKTKIGSAELQISNLQSGNQVLLVKVTLENDFTTTKKIIFK